MHTAQPSAPPPVRLIGAASALGAPHPGSADAPAALLRSGLVRQCAELGLALETAPLLAPETSASESAGEGTTMSARLATNARFAARLADALAAAPATARTFVLGGDHAIAAGSWRGLGRQAGLAPGLLWVDAHLDSHTETTTHSGNIHGMPLAALLGAGPAALAGIEGPTLDPARTCIFGARAWEAEERSLLARLGVRVFAANEIHARGLQTCFTEALGIVRADQRAGFGLSLDLDALDPQHFPAVTCPEPNGLEPLALEAALRTLRNCADFRMLEIVEYRPDLDVDGRCAIWISRLAAAALASGTPRTR